MTTSLLDLSGKRILITGASSGFGAHFAGVLSDAGAEVVLAARRVEKLEETRASVEAKGGKAQLVPMDVSNAESVANAFAQMGSIDVAINNAGINVIGATDTLTEEQWDSVIDTNLKGVWLVAKHAISQWKAENRRGNIINIASILGLRVANQLPPYTASKAAVVQLTKSIALDYGRLGIRCNAICPGYFSTDINRDFMESPAGQKQIKRIPFRRMGELHELNGPLLLLASDASSYMNGSIVAIDGGHLCSTL